MYTRRRVLGAVPAAAAVALAGCSGGNAATIGDSRELNDLTFTITEMQPSDTITTVPDDWSGDGGQETSTPDGTSTQDGTTGTTAAPPTTLNESPSGSRYVVVWFDIENETDTEKTLPTPGQAPVPFAEGNIYLTGLGQGTSLLTPEGDLWIDGEAHDSLLEQVGELDWTLGPGEQLTGWIMFAIDEGADLSKVSVTVQAEGNTARWELR